MDKCLAIDLDDTICFLKTPLMQALNLHTGKNIHWKEWNTWHIENMYGITSDEFTQVMIDGHVIERALPIPGVREALLQIKSKGYKLHIITARGWHPNGMDVTKRWFEENNIPYDTINIVPIDGSKSAIMNKFKNLKYLVDDSAHNCEEVISQGYEAFLINYPSNIHCKVNRIRHIEDIVDRL